MNTNTVTFIWLALGAFLLGAIPFSVWLGRLFLKKDIRNYGDGNPGAANVFRAGSVLIGTLAVILDIGKGVPFVVLSQRPYHLPEVAVLGVGLAAILGHAFSPLLGFKGGKALAVTAGVIIGLLNAELFFAFFLPALVAFLVLDSRAWLVVLSPLCTVIFLVASRASTWEILFMMCVLALFTFKHAKEIHSPPRLKPRLMNWSVTGRQP